MPSLRAGHCLMAQLFRWPCLQHLPPLQLSRDSGAVYVNVVDLDNLADELVRSQQARLNKCQCHKRGSAGTSGHCSGSIDIPSRCSLRSTHHASNSPCHLGVWLTMPAESMDFLQDGQRLWLYLRLEILSAIAHGQRVRGKVKHFVTVSC